VSVPCGTVLTYGTVHVHVIGHIISSGIPTKFEERNSRNFSSDMSLCQEIFPDNMRRDVLGVIFRLLPSPPFHRYFDLYFFQPVRVYN